MASFDSNLIFEKYKQVNEMAGFGYGVGKSINVPGPGSQSTGAKVVFNLVKPKHNHSECEEGKNGCKCGRCPDCTENAEEEDECGYSHDDEKVYIQAGDDAEDSNCGCGQSPCMSQDNDDDFDGEVDMARAELLKAAEYATKLFNHLANIESLEGWTASKITKASDYLSSVYHALEYDALDANVEDEEDDIEVDEVNE
jgi:hypothetical protein